MKKLAKFNICVVGGCGHVGLPLSIALADASKDVSVVIYDINKETVKLVSSGNMPFMEHGAEEKLRKTIGKNLRATTDAKAISECNVIIIVIGTPVDEYLNPQYKVFEELLNNTLAYFKNGQTVILRSTVFPGTSYKAQQYFKEHNLNIHISFCPERIAEGKAMDELYSLPQIVSGFDDEGLRVAREVFGLLTKDIIEITPSEAELAKLFTNSWRYIQLATANQYYMLASSMGMDFYRIYHAMTYKYPRTKDFPRAGFAAGPCLFKDTMQLSAFSRNQYFLGHSAMLVNEGLPLFIVQELKKTYDLTSKTVGILGMAFKGESDDKRDSLSYKLKKILEVDAKRVLCTDEYIKDERFLSLNKVIKEADILILCAPHNRYKTIKTDKKVIDVWNFINR